MYGVYDIGDVHIYTCTTALENILIYVKNTERLWKKLLCNGLRYNYAIHFFLAVTPQVLILSS